MDDFGTLETIMNDIGNGLVCVDESKVIRSCNEKAKIFTGIVIDVQKTHEEGFIVDGDIVIIADTKIGADDGELSSRDLESLNIRDSKIKQKDILLAVGVYKNDKISPEYKHFREHQINSSIFLKVKYLGFDITAAVDPVRKQTSISVGSDTYDLDYQFSVGNMVIIDGATGAIKFFQARGYSTRKEDLGNLLRGGSYHGKMSENRHVEVIGKKFLDFFDRSPLSDKLFGILEGKDEPVYNKLYEINKRLFICTMTRTRKDGRNLVFLIIRDVDNMEKLLNERNEMIRQVEERHASLYSADTQIPIGAFEDLVGRGDKINEVKYMAYKASQNRFHVIITGESGTGKSKIAREIHDLWKKNAPFVEVNCNAIAPTLLESELFGYVGGAFTGAKSEGKIGFFEAADGGTIFLDEIGEIPPEIQVKLLHVLQNKIIYKVGSTKETKIDVRVIAATNRDLEDEVLNGRFRQDLFYRINVFPIYIPPLRERKSDLYLLINHIVKKFCDYYGMELKQFSGEALKKLISYDWPGNIRELENAIERAITLCDSNIIYSEYLHIKCDSSPRSLKDKLALEEKRILEAYLIQNGGNRAEVMKELGLSKTVFYEKLKKYGIK